jgi:hypothetical protein
MTGTAPKKDLVLLAADLSIEFAMRGLLWRPHDLGIRTLAFDAYRHLHHDPGCLNESAEFLRSFLRSHAFAIVVFDREGCGRADLSAEKLEAQVESRLGQNGWGERICAIVIDPELEQWVWGDSPEVDRVVGWLGRAPGLRSWLRTQGLLGEGQKKPPRPKEALEAALRVVGKPRSASLYEELARTVPLGPCTDRSFVKLLGALRGWFDAAHCREGEP